MAEGSNKAKASTGYLQDGSDGLKKKKKVKKMEDIKPKNDRYGTPHLEHSKYSDRSSSTRANNNGNALQTSVNADLSKSSRRGGGSDGYQLVPKRKNRSNDKNDEIENSPSVASFQKRNHESLGSIEIVNSNRRISSGVKNIKNSVESDFVRNPEDSASTLRQEAHRNSSAIKNQMSRKLSTHSDEGAENFRKVKKNDSFSRGDKGHLQRSDGRNQIERNADNENNSKLTPVEPEEILTDEFMQILKENRILQIKKKNLRYPRAKYFCCLCEFHLSSKIDCDKHMKDYRHSRKKKLHDEDTILKNLPEPTEHQFAALTEAVEKMYEEHGISEKERKQRKDIVFRLEKKLKEKIPDVMLFMYGSSLTGFGLKTADINVDLTSADKNKKLTTLLRESYLSLKDRTDTGFSNVRSDFTAKLPALLMMDDLTGLTVNVTIHCYNAHCSSELLSIYSDFDIRVRKLAVAFRYWAHLCELDRQCDGFIPPQALNLMVIYFLQVISPQLVPIIEPPKVTGDEIGDYRKDAPAFEKRRAKVMVVSTKGRNNMSVGELWFRLLWFYCLEFDTPNVVVCIRKNQTVPRNTKPWNSKKLAVEDPYLLKKNVTGMVSNSRVNEFWEDSIRRVLHYFGFPRDAEGKSDISEEALQRMTHPNETYEEEEKDSSSTVLETKSFASFKLATPDKEGQTQKSKDNLIPLSQKDESMSHSESDNIKNSESDYSDIDDVTDKQLSFDSYDTQNNSSKIPTSCSSTKKPVSVSHRGNFSASTTLKDNHSLKLASLVSDISVGLSQTSDKNCILQRLDKSDTSLGAQAPSTVGKFVSPEKPVCKSNENIDAKSRNGSSNCIKSSEKPILGQKIASKAIFDSNDKNNAQLNSEVTQVPSTSLSESGTITDKDDQRSSQLSSCLEVTEATKDIMKLPEEQKEIFSVLAQTGCHYEFSKEFLTDGKGPVLVCTYCESEGHLKNACPEDKLPDVLPLPPLTPLHVKVLSETLSKVPSIVGLSLINLADRANFLKALEEFIQVQFKDAELALFGSSCNGFGFDRSDMDICLTFSQRKKIDKPWLIESLARKMKQNKDLFNVQAISTAKVPIVKFTVKRTGLEGDISLYNILAQHNTKLLLCYSQIDPRVQILGYAIKNFAKVCDIGDASRGSLSSYAYILMMIYYLQQVVPPVVPVLQELYKTKDKPQLMIEGCDAWFMDDLTQLDVLWSEKDKNKMSSAELWLGFLRFYVEEFNYKELVVCIRQKEPLTRFEKLWNGESIAIEDPFDQSHNLGGGLARKMNNFIFRTFINGRMLYGSPIDDNMEIFNSYPTPYKYFFDPELLSESRPPNSRGCHCCGKIGHLARNCPQARKEREQQRRFNKDQRKLHQEQKESEQEHKQSQEQKKEQPPPQQRQVPEGQQQRHPPSSPQERQQQQSQQKLSENFQQIQQQSKSLQPQQQYQSQLSHPQKQHQSQPLQPQQHQNQPSHPQQQHQSQPLQSKLQQQSQPLRISQPQQQNQPPKEMQQRQPLLQQQKMQPFQSQQQEQPAQPLQWKKPEESVQLFRPQRQGQPSQQLQPPQQQEQREPSHHPQLKQPEESKQLFRSQRQGQPSQQPQPPQQQEQREPSHHPQWKQPEESKQHIIHSSSTQQSQTLQKQQLKSSFQPKKQLRQSPQPQHQQDQREPSHHPQREQPEESKHNIFHSSYTHQPLQQQLRSSFQPEKQLSQSPQPQHQGQSFQPHHHIRQSPQPMQQQIQYFHPQQQWPLSQPQLLQQNHPLQPQQFQLQQQYSQQLREREFFDRQERGEQWQNSQAGNMNSNSSISAGPRMPLTFDNQASIALMTGNLQTQVFHNANYMSPYHLQQQYRSFMSNNPVALTLGSMPPPLMSILPTPAFNQPLLPPPGLFEYPQAQQNCISGNPHGNQPFSPGAQHSGHGNGGNNVRGMIPAVQNLFDSAHMKTASSDLSQRQK